jgi:hypothetical protein
LGKRKDLSSLVVQKKWLLDKKKKAVHPHAMVGILVGNCGPNFAVLWFQIDGERVAQQVYVGHGDRQENTKYQCSSITFA